MVSPRPFNSWDALKLLALLLMFCDHAGAYIFTGDEARYWLRALGRGAPVIFFFLAGYAQSYRFRRDVFILAVLLTGFAWWVTGTPHALTLLFTILGCRFLFDEMEKRGRRVRRPWEWFVCALVLFPSAALTQYGSFGFLMALSGYLARRASLYPAGLPRYFLAATLLVFGLYQFQYSRPPLSPALLAATLAGVFMLLSRFTVQDIAPGGCPAWLVSAGRWAARHSAYIYAAHLALLVWLTGLPV